MKKVKSLIALATCVIAFATCVENDPGVVTPEDEKPEPTMVGIPIGMPVTKTIGPAGGTIEIAGLVELSIPAGALGSDTDISIQPLTNNAPNGNGNAYRFGPEGTKFNKPVKVTFPYSLPDITMPPLTGIAFQDTDGIWYSSGKFTWDATNKTVSTETTHFSDWATFDILKIQCEDIELNVSEATECVLFALRNYPATPLANDEDLTPLRTSVPVGSIDAFDLIVEEWRANGDNADASGPYGTIAPTSKGCTYTAPPRVPAFGKNPVSLSVTLKDLLYRDPATGTVFQDLQVATSVLITGELKFDLVVTFNSKDEVTGGLVGKTFTLRDEAKMRIVVNDDTVTASNFQNSPGIVTPSSQMDDYGNTSVCVAQSTFLGPLNVTECTGMFGNFSAGKPELWLTIKGEGQSPPFEWYGATGGQVAINSQTGKLMQIIILDLTKETPTWQTPGSNILSATLTRVE